jgi:diguanylate cyclase
MPSWSSFFAKSIALPLLTLGTILADSRLVSAKAAPLAIEGLGRGTIALDGPWQFQLGDDPAWAAPAFDDSSWEQLTADRPWAEQHHANYSGFAWYRCDIALTHGPIIPQKLSLLVPSVDDAYEIYWNGKLIGQNGKLPPHPVWYYSQPAQIFQLGEVQHGVLALRVWKAPLLSDDSGAVGGFSATPLVGSPEAIASAKATIDYRWLSERQFLFGENLLFTLVALLSFLLWCRNPSQWLLFWMTGFALVSPAILLLLKMNIRWPYLLVMGVAQPLSSIRDISLWFLLLWLLRLRGNRALVRLARILSWIRLCNACLDGALVAVIWDPQWIGMCQTADAISAFISSTLEAFPLVLVGCALLQRKPFDSASRLVAIVAFLDEMVLVFRNTVKQGQRFTQWPIAAKVDAPLFVLGGSAISLHALAGAILLLAIVYSVYHSIFEDWRRQEALEREKGELMRASEQMRYHAEHDGLTRLWNHRIIVERLRGEVDRSRRDGTPLSVILADIDHFKKINDSFGHTVGDLVLRDIGTIFTSSVRSYDLVGRYGGEEFLLILPGTPLNRALIRAEELRLAVESAHIFDGEATLQVTASFGVASEFPPDYEVEAIIRAVDGALYRAKNSGRNCVIAAEMCVSVRGPFQLPTS